MSAVVVEEAEPRTAADPVAEPAEDPTYLPDPTMLRGGVAVLIVCVGTGLMAGGIFSGVVGPRAFAVIAAILGAQLADWTRRVRRAWLLGLLILIGIFLIGVATAVFADGIHVLPEIGKQTTKALAQVRLVRPPIGLSGGFGALLGWLMGGTGFAAMWVTLVVRRPVLGLLVPLPIAAITAISVPHYAQLASGLLLFGSFAIALGVLAGERSIAGGEGLPLRYELRRAARAAPLLAAAIVALVFANRSGFLFPKPIVNPAVEPQKPKPIPLSQAPDRVLFEVQSSVRGPWVMGALDVYDGKDWRLPAFSQAKLVKVPRSGIVDDTLQPGLKATFTVRGLEGAVLPSLPNTLGIIASGPQLAYDARSGNIRLVEGEIPTGFRYTLAAAGVPQVADLVRDTTDVPAPIRAFTRVPDAPPAVRALVDRAPKTSAWEQWDWLRRYVLDNITANGLGTPVSITPARVDEILARTKEASPFEIVAIQTLLARWVGIPARIGYGFDGGTRTGEVLEVHPRDGAVFPQVYFAKHGWLPVIGIPQKTKVSDLSDPRLQQYRPGVLPSNDIAVTIFRPIELPAPKRFDVVRNVIVTVAGLLLAAWLVYLLLPVFEKALRISRERARAIEAGPAARIALAYAEWRDTITDYGYRYTTDTPLMLLRRFARDEEHNQLAWLVTRTLWGDLQTDVTDEMAADAEELSRALRRRLADAHPMTVRIVAALSRHSMRTPYSSAVPVDRRRPVSEVLDSAAV